MKREFYLSTFFIALILSTASCGGSAPANNAANSNNTNTSPHGQITTKTPQTETLNNAPSLGPVVQQYYRSLETKDDAKLRETMTATFQKNLEADMKAAGRRDFAAYVAETDYRPGQVIEVRNEKIDGDRGVAELRGGAYKNWTAFSFAKEDGRWKFTGGSPETDNMPKSNTNSPH